MVNLALLIEKAEKQLEDQSKAVKAAQEDTAAKEQAWHKAEGQAKAALEEGWQVAVRREEAEREKESKIEARLQKLIDKLPSAGEQALSLSSFMHF